MYRYSGVCSVDGIRRPIYLVGEFHDNNKCKAKHFNNIDYPAFYKYIFQTQPRPLIDFYYETSPRDIDHDKNDHMGVMRDEIQSCLNLDSKTNCDYENLRIHWTDTRFGEHASKFERGINLAQTKMEQNFRTENESSQYARNVILHYGNYHTDEYLSMFKTLGLKFQSYGRTIPRNQSCYNLSRKLNHNGDLELF